MTLYEELLLALPELESSNAFLNGEIILQDDSDGYGEYIFKWEYSQPIPDGLKLGK
jgi:hypothetical protein